MVEGISAGFERARPHTPNAGEAPFRRSCARGFTPLGRALINSDAGVQQGLQLPLQVQHVRREQLQRCHDHVTARPRDHGTFMPSASRIVPVLLSGGTGTRLWPLSREAYPKQLLPLAGKRTMLQETALRSADRERF